ncbi:MAG: TonB-dependent receptor [Betaproteobacteria bacterium]
MPRRRIGLAITAALLTTSATSFAQALHDRRDSQNIEPVVVTATRDGIAVTEAPASVTIIDEEQIEQRRASRIGDVLGEVPGLYVRSNTRSAQFPSSGQASISIRGVPRTTRALVMVDGQPINNALSGGINLSSIMLDNVRRIEIVRGPYSALYGGNAMGGVINILTKTPVQREMLGKIEAGFGDVSSSAGSLVFRDRLDNGFSWSLALGYRHSDGWHDSDYVVKALGTGASALPVTGARLTSTTSNQPAAWVGVKGDRPWDQRNAELKIAHDAGTAGIFTVGLAFAGYRVGYQPPESFLSNGAGQPVWAGNVQTGLSGGGRIALAESDFYTLTPSQEHDWRGFVHWERQLAGGTRIVANAGHMNHGFRFAQPGAGALYDSGPGEWADQPNWRTDADVHLRWMASDSLWLTTGVALNKQQLDRGAFTASSWRDFDTRTTQTSRGVGASDTAAWFAQAEYVPVDALTLHAGVRFDRFSTSGEVSQTVAPPFVTGYARRSEQQFSPKLAVVYVASKSLTLRASYGAGFRPPTLLDLYSRTVSPTTVAGVFSVNEPAPDLKAERIRAYEIGLEAQLPGQATLSAAAFTQTLSDLIYRSRKSANLTQSTNAGRARVEGVELTIRQPLFDRALTVFANATQLTRYEMTVNSAIPASVGKKLTDVPGVMLNAGVEFTRPAWSGSLVAAHVGPIFGSGDDLNINTAQGVYGSYDRHTVVNAKLAYKWTRHVSTALSVDNLLNRQYFDFYKQPGMTALLDLAVKF